MLSYSSLNTVYQKQHVSKTLEAASFKILSLWSRFDDVISHRESAEPVFGIVYILLHTITFELHCYVLPAG